MGKLLIVADQEKKSQVAIERGVEMAKAIGDHVDIVGFCYESLQGAGGDKKIIDRAVRSAVNQRKLFLSKFAEPLSSKTCRISVSSVWEKNIHQWLTAKCKSSKYDMVVKSGKRKEQMFFTPTDWHLLRECPAPVMIVSEKKWRKTKPILAALDLSSSRKTKLALNHKVLTEAVNLANKMNKKIMVIHALEVSQVLADMDVIDERKVAREQRAKLKSTVQELAKQYKIPEENFLFKTGQAKDVIPSIAAKQRADIVVIGTVGRTGVKARVIGNTAEQILHHLHTDVLAIKP